MKKNIFFAKYKRSNVYTDPKPNDPKYIFTVISDMIKQDYNADNANFLDIGGANGDFSNYVQSTFPKFKTTCSHSFHYKCIHRWCFTNNSCPTLSSL